MFSKKPEIISIDSILDILDEPKTENDVKLSKSSEVVINNITKPTHIIKNNTSKTVTKKHQLPVLEDRFIGKDIKWI